jgi:hypothetical protein
MSATPRLTVRGIHYARNPAFVPVARLPIVNTPHGSNKAAARLNRAGSADIFASHGREVSARKFSARICHKLGFVTDSDLSQTRNDLAASTFQISALSA